MSERRETAESAKQSDADFNRADLDVGGVRAVTASGADIAEGGPCEQQGDGGESEEKHSQHRDEGGTRLRSGSFRPSR